MNEFDKLYDEISNTIEENSLKSLATAGLLGLGALAGTPAEATPPPAKHQVQHYSDQTILDHTLPITAWAEGFRDTAYLDSKNIPTIGYGFNLNSGHIAQKLQRMGYSVPSLKAKRQQISRRDADLLLKDELQRALGDAKAFVNNWDNLDPYARMVVLDMAYNLGYTRLSKFHNFKSALERYDYSRAKAEMIDSKWYNDVGRRSKYLTQVMDKAINR